jgi:hypothetical protein
MDSRHSHWLAVLVAADPIQLPLLARIKCQSPMYYKGENWAVGYNRQSATLWLGSPPVMPPGFTPAKNTQFITIGLGKLFIQAISVDPNGLQFDEQPGAKRHARRIWPYDSGL